MMEQLTYSSTQLAQALGYKDRASLYHLIVKDPTFPKPIRLLSPRSDRRWRRADVEAWLAKQPSERVGA
jgi:predicted DNA-binding transcriptional regulator AlpA